MGVTGNWIRGQPIGRGSSATVTLAKASSSGDIFAVKSVPTSRSALLQKEQRILSALNDSPAIISCFGSDVTFEDSLHVYNLFLEYAPCGSLADEVKNGHLDEETIRSRTSEILIGLSFFHSRGFAHCDVKSDNILIGSDGRAKIADLGCARCMGDTDTHQEDPQIRGSPAFMAPEVARGEEQGPPADVWALGCTIIEMATGKHAWPGMSDPMSLLHHVAFSDHTPELPKWVSGDCHDFLYRCFERDPSERWSADQLLKHPFLGTSGTSKPRSSPKSTLDQWLWESFSGQEDDEDLFVRISQSIGPTERIRQLDCSSCLLPSWCWDEDWVPVRNLQVQDVLILDMVTNSSSINDPSSIDINCFLNDDDDDDDDAIGIPASTQKTYASPKLLFYCNMCSVVPSCRTIDLVNNCVQSPPIGSFLFCSIIVVVLVRQYIYLLTLNLLLNYTSLPDLQSMDCCRFWNIHLICNMN